MSTVSQTGLGDARALIDERKFVWHLRGVVSVTAAGPVVRVRGHEYLMPGGANYPPGAELQLRLVFAEDGWQLQIAGLAGRDGATEVASTSSGSEASGIEQLLARLNLPVAAAQAARLLPTHLPRSAEAISTLIHRLAAAAGAGPALGLVIRSLTDAAAAGVALSPSAAAVVGWLVGPSGAPEQWKAMMRRTGGPTPEALLARLIGEAPATVPTSALSGASTAPLAGRELHSTPEQVLAELARDERLTAFMQRRGRESEWQCALTELQGRIDGDRLLALHGLESPYRFLELPMRSRSGWDRAQLHLLGGPGPASTAVLDLCTEHLGNVWMALRATRGGGRLRVQAQHSPTLKAFAECTGELARRLSRAGYEGVSVELEPWDGDRISAAVDLFEGLRPTEVLV